MISLKKYMETGSEKLLNSLRESYRGSLASMGESAVQICPHISENLHRSLVRLRDHLTAEATPEAIAETGKQADREMEQWGKDAAEYFRQTATEVKELMMLVAQTSQAVGDRDQRYARQFGDFAGRLQAIGKLEDLSKIRESIGVSANQLRTCVEKMVQDGQEAVIKLRTELTVYQVRLNEVEQIATQDPVTGLANRRKVERQLQLKIEQARDFSVVMFDVNNFKQINDTHGHLAGDELLKQFAGELRNFFRATDVVSRWGGDEFLVILEAKESDVRNRVDSVRKWVCGEYTVPVKGEPRKLQVSASVGTAAWRPGETANDLLGRADAAMYEEKARWRKESGLPVSAR